MESSRRSSSFSNVEQRIGSYIIGATVGKGSFGKVKKGRHITTDEPVAIKILNRQKLKTANMDKKIHREIEILKLFSHPNICRLYEVISTPTDMYLIMEYVEGGELYDYIVQKGRVPEKEARYIFQQIVCALEYCHHFRVVHRDLKPENILLGPGLQVKLIDFGLSNIMKDGEFLTTSCGSPNYAAPEVISGKLYFGPEVDVWSCGVILYALLCGCLPFDEDSIPLLFSKIKKGKYTIPTTIPGQLRQLIKQILVVDPLIRETIPQLRDNEWFNRKLPLRLTYHESLFTAQEDRINPVLVGETAKRLNIHERDVRRAIEQGEGPAYVAYSILLDVKRRREITAEVRELGILDKEVAGMTEEEEPRPSFQPKAMARELNMGLMLTQSPAMEALLDHQDATTNKATYNSGGFVPASAQERRTGANTLGESPVSVGSFRMTTKAFSSSSVPNSYRTPGESLSLLGASLQEQPRVGSVARKHPMYTAEEERFIVEHNVGWRVGLMTDWHGERVLASVYGVLKRYKMEWKVLAPFRLAARTTDRTWGVLAHEKVADSPVSRNTEPPTPVTGSKEEGNFPAYAPPSPAASSSHGSPSGAVPPVPFPEKPTYTIPAQQVILSLHVLRINERHDKGFLVDFAIRQNTLCGFDVVLHISNDLIQLLG